MVNDALSKFNNTAGCHSNLPVNSDKHRIFAHTAGARCTNDLPQTLHVDRAGHAHPKMCQPFFDVIHSISAGGENVDFWLLSKNNTVSLPLRGNPDGNKQKKQTPSFRTYSDLPQTLHGDRARRGHHKRWHSFFDPTHSFCYRFCYVFARVHGKIWPNLPTRGFSAIPP